MKGGLNVTNQTAGLRFDIFERIELPMDVEAIRQLEDIELTPQIQMFADEEQAILRGHLLLAGAYEGEDMRGQHRLEHKIPVEISLPMHRVVDVDHIGVEIENFDVDVLSDRKLSVTGVLSLNGVDVQQREAFGQNNIGVVISDVDQSERERDAKQSAAVQKEAVQRKEAVQGEAVQKEAVPRDAAVQEALIQQDAPVQLEESEQSESGHPENERAVSEPAVINIDEENAMNEHAEVAEAPRVDEELQFEFESDASPGLEEQESALQEAVKIAFRQQRADADSFGEPDVARDLKDSGETDPKTLETEADEGQSDEEVRSTSETDWKNFLLARDNEGGEAPQFKKMKMCIIQKEETLSTIAERYSINPREIILYNRLGEQEVEEGQVIYIPVS